MWLWLHKLEQNLRKCLQNQQRRKLCTEHGDQEEVTNGKKVCRNWEQTGKINIKLWKWEIIFLEIYQSTGNLQPAWVQFLVIYINWVNVSTGWFSNIIHLGNKMILWWMWRWCVVWHCFNIWVYVLWLHRGSFNEVSRFVYHHYCGAVNLSRGERASKMFI